MRALATLVIFLLALTAVVASASEPVDTAIVILAWAAFIVGSFIIVVKSIRRGRTDIYGQAGALPRSWRRWVFDEPKKRHPKQ